MDEGPGRRLRRHVRIHCTLSIGESSYGGFTRNVSESGVYVLIRDERAATISPGHATRLRLELPDEGALVDCPGEIAWADPGDRDIDGAPVVGVGVRLHLEDARLGEDLHRFVEAFRYVVLVAGGGDAERARVMMALSADYSLVPVRSVEGAAEVLDRREVAVLLVLPDLIGASAAEFLEQLSARYPRLHAARVVVSREPTVEELRGLVNRGGMLRSLPSDVDDATLRLRVREAADRYALDTENQHIAGELERTKRWLERENTYLRQRLTGVEGFDKIVGNSPQLQGALRQLERIRRTDAPVYIHGETGTGKELVARALHVGGPRAERSYVVQNCAGMTETLLQSTLFGHRKGAFTGADRDHRGVFLEADGGTLFLDEVGELSPATQAMLLRSLQEGEITPVGASRPIKVDVRIISATHKDLREEVKAGRFREDLLYRLVVVTVRLPPLRERQGDVALLARHFLDLHCEHYGKDVPGFRSEVMAAFEAYAWPGNVRELDNEIERMVILGDDGEKLAHDTLSAHIMNSGSRTRGAGAVGDPARDYARLPYDEAVERLERALIEAALKAEGGSVTKAADRLGVERSRLGKIKKRLRIGEP